MNEPSKEAMEIINSFLECIEKDPNGIPLFSVDSALAIDALCAERVNAETEKEREEWKTRFDDWRIPMADKIAALTAERNRYKAALEAIIIYATVRGMDYEPSNIARAALEEVEA